MASKVGSSMLLRALAETVERLGEDRTLSILRDAGLPPVGRPRYAVGGAVKGAVRAREKVPVRDALVAQVFERLRAIETREAGVNEIDAADMNRRELETLARKLDVPVRKDQRVGDLRDLIVNVTIGGRLNSRAIRGSQ